MAAWPDVIVLSWFSPSNCFGMLVAMIYGAGKWSTIVVGPIAPTEPKR